MQRANFIVYDKNGVGWCANHLTIASQNSGEGDGHGQISVLTFICSGSIVTIPASRVDRVEFNQAGATFCSECDQSIGSIVGAGIHANPKAEETK